MLKKLFIFMALCTFLFSGACAKYKEVAVISTKFGDIVIEFFDNKAPGHVKNFKKLAKEGFYDGCTFHRVIPGFMIQGGDPNSKDENRSNDGMGGPGYTINAEFNDIKHAKGIVSMARAQDPNSAGSQFFIMAADGFSLDGNYSVFGKVIEGIDTADMIVSQERDQRDNPLERIDMKVKITDYDTYKAGKKKAKSEGD